MGENKENKDNKLWNRKSNKIIINNKKDTPRVPMDSFYRMISLMTDKKADDVKEVIISMEELLNYLLIKGYQVNIPNIGTFRPIIHKGYEKGRRVPIYEKGIGGRLLNNTDIMDTTKKKIVEEDGQYYLEYIKSSSDYYIPKFTYSRSVKDKLKDGSIKWEE